MIDAGKLNMTAFETDHSRLGICVISHAGYDSLCGGQEGKVGGAERQHSLMARWFAARGYRVSMLTWDEGQPDDEDVAGVRVIKICGQNEGIRGLRFFHPKWTGLYRAMRRADADVYCFNLAECATGQVAWWTRRNRRKFVFWVVAEKFCRASLSYLTTIRQRVLYRYGLRRADRIIVQTRKQRSMLLEGCGLDSVVLPTPCAGPAERDYIAHEVPNADSFRILWIGRICRPKRPDRLLDLARKCPEWRFDLAGPAGNSEYGRRMHEEAKKVPNITVHGLVSRSRLPEFYKRASCLCCTSATEGFPNTFLEAWSYGLPVVSTFDPDGLIATRGLGVAAHDVPGLIAGIRSLVSSPERYRLASDSARRYYVENHMFDASMRRFERVFLDVAGGVDRPGRRSWPRDRIA